MKSNLYLPVTAFLLLGLFFQACTGHRKFQKGDYDRALDRSIAKLRKSPSNKKAARTFYQAYNMKVSTNMNEIDQLKNSKDPFKWEAVVVRYQQLNRLYDEINRCPACLKKVPDPNQYSLALNEALSNAALVRYNLGLEQLKLNTLYSAQEAYRHFFKAQSYVPGFKDVDQQMKSARALGTIHVVMEHIPMHSRTMQISNEFFENRIQEYLQNLNYEFVEFYTPEEAKSYNVKAHQYIQCRFDDFVVGQTSLYEKEEQVVKDSVILKTEILSNKEKKYTYGTVKANFHGFTKTVTSSGLLDLRIVDGKTGSVISEEKFPGTYVWETRWAWFNGDERALSKDQIQLSKQREAYPPLPQQLFIEFTKPIFNQMTGKLRGFYGRYAL